jgi:chorismate dehydratase
MSEGADPVSIFGIRFLNARPLLAGLEAGVPAEFPYRFRTADPSVCAATLAKGSAGAALVPVASLPSCPGARALAHLGVSCREEVRSVLLISRVPLARVRRLAGHAASRTSLALARLLLAERWGATPELRLSAPPLSEMLADADAAVIIGDPALEVRGRSGLEEVDLGAAWVEWTGLPFVFAVWAVDGGAPPGLPDLLEASLDFAEAHWDELVSRWARLHRLPADTVRHYLGTTLTHRLDDVARQGLAVFLERAGAAGLLDAAPAGGTGLRGGPPAA